MTWACTERTSTGWWLIQTSSSSVMPIRMEPWLCITAVSAFGRSISTPDSLTKEAVTMKKISMMKTMSIRGVMSIP